MVGVVTIPQVTTLCGVTLTTRGTTGIGICATTLIIGDLAIMLAIIRTSIDLTIRIIDQMLSLVRGIDIRHSSVVTRRRATHRQHLARALQRQQIVVELVHRRIEVVELGHQV